MVTLVVYLCFLLSVTAIGNIDLAADDWFQAGLLAGAIKFNDAVHGAMIGESDGFLAVLFGERDHIIYLRHPVQKRVMGMRMEMDESCPHTHRAMVFWIGRFARLGVGVVSHRGETRAMAQPKRESKITHPFYQSRILAQLWIEKKECIFALEVGNESDTIKKSSMHGR